MIVPDVATIFARQRDADPLVIDFARALAAASRIEVELVRHMRLELFPDADAGLEANLWFSPLVAERDVLGLSLVPECRDELRRQLALPEHRETLKRAWDVIVKCHRPDGQAGIPPVINLQEEITYHALAGPASDTPHVHRRAMQTEIGTLIKALDDDVDGSLVQWVARALPALPEAARQSAAAISLAEKVRARDASISLESVPRPDQHAGTATWTGTTIAVGCQRRTDGIELSVPPATGAHVLQLPRTSPLVVEIQTPRFDGWHARSIEFEPVPQHVVPDPSPGSRCRITSATGHRISVQPTYGSAPPALMILGRRVSQMAALQDAIDDIGWTVGSIDDDLGNRLVRAVLVPDPFPPDAWPFEGRVAERLSNGEAALLAWTKRGPQLAGDVASSRVALTPEMNAVTARFSAGGEQFAMAGPSGVHVWSKDAALLWNHRERAGYSISFTPAGYELAFVSDDALVRMWWMGYNVAVGFEGHRDRVTSVEFSSQGHLVSTSMDRTAILWSQSPSKIEPRLSLQHGAPVLHASFSPGDAWVATAAQDGSASVWEVANGRKVASIVHDSPVLFVGWTSDGQHLVTASSTAVRVFATSTFDLVGVPLIHEQALESVAIAPNGRSIATLDRSGAVRVWHLASRALMNPVANIVSLERGENAGLTFSPDGRRLVIANRESVRWNLVEFSSSPMSVEEILRRTEIVPLPRTIPSEHLAALRRQLLAIDERTLQIWEARGAAARESAAVEAPPLESPQTPVDSPERPRRALVGIIDDGIDVLHETFLDENGRSRIVAIWDQTDATGPLPEGFTYGSLHSAESIASYVQARSVPKLLGRNKDGHGTHVASIAAGRRVGRFQGGVAPDASIVVVRIAQDRRLAARWTLDGLAFIERMATERQSPVVVNVSLSLNLGSHDGKSAFEVGVDEFSGAGLKPGRVVVVPAGNGRADGAHAQLQLLPGTVNRLRWEMDGDVSMAFVQLWAPASASYRFRLTAPSGAQSDWVSDDRPTISNVLKGAGGFSLQLTRRHVDNGDTQLSIQLGDAGRRTVDGVWELTIETPIGSEERMDTWCDAVDGDIRFLDHVSESMTIGVPATARTVVAVSAVRSPATPIETAVFSALGPTRDGWQKPDVAAPGIDIDGARGGTVREVIRLTGTSMAAAHVAGAIAMLLDSGAADRERWPTANQIKAALRQTAVGSTGTWDPGVGYGVVNAQAFVRALAIES